MPRAPSPLPSSSPNNSSDPPTRHLDTHLLAYLRNFKHTRALSHPSTSFSLAILYCPTYSRIFMPPARSSTSTLPSIKPEPTHSANSVATSNPLALQLCTLDCPPLQYQSTTPIRSLDFVPPAHSHPRAPLIRTARVWQWKCVTITFCVTIPLFLPFQRTHL